MPFMVLAARNLKMIKVLNRGKFVALAKKKHKESLTRRKTAGETSSESRSIV
jgi:hypothetical protein